MKAHLVQVPNIGNVTNKNKITSINFLYMESSCNLSGILVYDVDCASASAPSTFNLKNEKINYLLFLRQILPK
jgi:hypothetical protein